VRGSLNFLGFAALAFTIFSLASRAFSQTQPAQLPVQPLPTPPPAAASTSSGTPEPAATPANLLANIIEDYNYDPKGKRDPFEPFSAVPKGAATAEGPMFPLQKFDLSQLKLIGIIWDNHNPKAMILDPNGKGYIIRTNERVGRNNGYVARIREGEIVVVESFTGNDGKTSYQTKLVKLSQE